MTNEEDRSKIINDVDDDTWSTADDDDDDDRVNQAFQTRIDGLPNDDDEDDEDEENWREVSAHTIQRDNDREAQVELDELESIRRERVEKMVNEGAYEIEGDGRNFRDFTADMLGTMTDKELAKLRKDALAAIEAAPEHHKRRAASTFYGKSYITGADFEKYRTIRE